MRASIVFSTIFTTAAFAAPILDGTSEAVTGKATDLADNLETTLAEGASGITKRGSEDVGNLNDLSNLGDLSDVSDVSDLSKLTSVIKRGTEDLSDLESTLTGATGGIFRRQDEEVVDDVPAGDISRRTLGLEDLLSSVTSLLSDVTGIADDLESTLTNLVSHVDGADVEGILIDVEVLADKLLAKVQEIDKDAGLGLDLSTLQPSLNAVSDEVGAVVKQVQSLADIGVVSDLVEEISSVLEYALRLVDNLLSVKSLVGSS